jgi:hypothetical protein
MKLLIKFTILLTFLLSSCSVEPVKWVNVYIKIKPGEQEYLEITNNVNNGFKTVKNGEDFYIAYKEWEEEGEVYYGLSYSGQREFCCTYFDGYWNYATLESGEVVEDYDIEMDFEYKTPNSFIVTGKLKPGTDRLLQISYKE